ncbi:unnamed protein product [Dicrocoelium dendriticum]|nr:unnamed protein product [Dicrocoelium dendriticum]
MMALPNRLLRKSTVITNAVPVYHKELKLVAYAADKVVILLDLASFTSRNLTGHTDTVTTFQFHSCNSMILVSGGLDGRLIEWDLRTGTKLKQTKLDLPITFVHGPFICLQLKKQYCLRMYTSAFEAYTTAFESCNTPLFSIGGGKDRIVAHVQNLDLFVYWVDYRVTTSEMIIATGNGIGEIFIWYHLASVTEDSFQDPLDVLEEDSKGILASAISSFEPVKQAVLQAKACGSSFDYHPTHPSKVKRNIIHWHSSAVKTMCFTSTGSHLLSGGLEGVLVKWDTAECLGGPRQRRFLPRLGAPIFAVANSGGPSEDTISLTLENNAMYILTGALKTVYFLQGFVQMPLTWRSVHSFSVPVNVVVLPYVRSHQNIPPLVLTNGAMGFLQLLDFRRRKLEIAKVNVSRQLATPRDKDPVLPVSFSEVFLVALSPPVADYYWICTYERLRKMRGRQIDDQSRITWWNYHNQSLPDDITAQNALSSLFMPMEVTSLSHLGSTASSLGFVSSKNLMCYLLLQDFRLLVMENRGRTVSSNFEWVKRSCHRLCLPNSSSLTNTECPQSTVIKYAAPCSDGTTEERFLLVLTAGTEVFIFDWDLLLDEGCPHPLLSLDLAKSTDRITSTLFAPLAVVHKPVVLWSGSEPPCYLAVYLRGHVPDETPATSRTSGVLCVLRLHRPCEDRWALDPVTVTADLTLTCIDSHPHKPLVAVGLQDGTAAVFRLILDGPSVYLDRVQSFPALPAHPLCDRRRMHRSGSKSKIRIQPPATRLLSLHFLPDLPDTQPFRLVGLLETLTGRERGRRDVVTYNLADQPSDQDTPGSIQSVKEQPISLLDMCAPNVPSLVAPKSRKRPAIKSDTHFEDTLRQISSYPIHTAPAPEQVLRQLMDKSS